MTDLVAVTDAAYAAELDAADPLAAFRSRFVEHDPGLVYLDGNSLGRLPSTTRARLATVVEDEWGGELVRGWDHWLDEPLRVGDRLAPILGALPGEVAVTDSTTVNVYKLAWAALEARPGRGSIVTDRANFPTDRYVLEGLAAHRGLSIRWLDADPVEGIRPAGLAAMLDDDVALVTFSHVNYRSAAIADVPAITRLAHDAGALVLWDLSHSAGVVPVELEASGADLAVGCTYKYLNAGPGAPAFLYIHRALQDQLRSPIQGWFAQQDQFAMGHGFRPVAGIGAWLAGTPGILGLAAVDEGAALVGEAGTAAIRAKSMSLTEYAIALHDDWLAPLGFSLGSPREASRRGSHVAVRHPRGRELSDTLRMQGVITDFRAPDSIRLGLSPLTTSFSDVHRGIDSLRDAAGQRD
jgi:kynureninase